MLCNLKQMLEWSKHDRKKIKVNPEKRKRQYWKGVPICPKKWLIQEFHENTAAWSHYLDPHRHTPLLILTLMSHLLQIDIDFTYQVFFVCISFVINNLPSRSISQNLIIGGRGKGSFAINHVTKYNVQQLIKNLFLQFIISKRELYFV